MHPEELTETERKFWKKYAGKEKWKQPFPQLKIPAAFLMALLLCLSCQTAFAFSESDAQAQVEAAGREAVSGNVLVWISFK